MVTESFETSRGQGEQQPLRRSNIVKVSTGSRLISRHSHDVDAREAARKCIREGVKSKDCVHGDGPQAVNICSIGV